MTSEGQYAGSQPAEATSGGPSDGFPPDSDGQRIAGRASAPPPVDGFPSSYAPPPPSTPNGGSPFVVPAVRTFGNGSEAAGAPYGSARAPQADHGEALPQRGAASPYGSVSPGSAASPYGSVSPPAGQPNGTAAPSPFASQRRPDSSFDRLAGPGSPFDRAQPAAVPASGNAPEPPRSAWAPQPAPTPAEGGDHPIPLPQRTPSSIDPGTIGEFDGFAAGTPGRGTVAEPPAGDVDPATGRPPGVSAFGDQRVRVPGATLTDLPDAPTPGRSPRSTDSGGFPARTSGDEPGSAGRLTENGGFPLRSGNAAFPIRRGDSGGGFPLRGSSDPSSGGFPLRGPAADPQPEMPGQPVADLPIRSQQAPFGPPPVAAAPPATGSPFSAFGPPPTPEEQPDPYGRPPGEQPADPYGRPSGGHANPFAEQQPDPFGRPSAEQPADPFGRRPGADAAEPPARTGLPDPFGRPGPDDQPFGTARPASPAASFGSDAPPAAATYGSARPASPAPPYGSDAPAGPTYGSARPASPFDSDAPAAATYGSARPTSLGSDAPAGQTYGSAPYDADQSAPPFFGSGSPDEPAGPARPASPAVYGSSRPAFDDDPNAGDPFGRADAPAGDPFGRADAPAAHPFGRGEPPAADPFGRGDAPAGDPFGRGDAPAGDPFGRGDGPAADPFGRADSPAGDPFGRADSPAGDPFGRGDAPVYGSARPGSPAFGGEPESDDHAIYRRPGSPADSGGGSGYPQRVPGAALGSPLMAENRNGPVPQPRDPAEHAGPAVGSARPVTASAAVPSASRVAPVDPGELPPPAAAPQARVYGRPAAPPEPDDDDPPDPAESSPFGEPADHDRPPFGTSGFGSVAYGGRPDDHDGPGGNIAQSDPGAPGIAPQSPARATARASASARVAPPVGPEQARNEPPFADLTRPAPEPTGPPGGYAPEQYSELTTDIAGREQQHYVPAPAFPPMPPNSGPPEYPGAVSRATVTPPSPDDTTNWPGPADQNRFDAFKPEAAPAKPETPHVRMLPILIAVVVGAVLLLGLVFGIVYLVAGGKSETFTVSTGECVKKDGDAAVKADCGDAAAFQVVSIVDDKSKCADPNQPYVVNPTSDGKNQVLCLKPQG
jgi:hypothetical protein